MIEMTTHGVKLHGRSIPLANMEQKLLAYFMEHPNTALFRETIFREVWVGYLSQRLSVHHVPDFRRRAGQAGSGSGSGVECGD